MFDVVGDVLEMTHMSLTANKTGVVYVGGGTPKNYIQQCGVAGYLFGRQRRWAGLSGCTFEAQSWRRYRDRFITARGGHHHASS
jgi:deoxyhypusine synthase